MAVSNLHLQLLHAEHGWAGGPIPTLARSTTPSPFPVAIIRTPTPIVTEPRGKRRVSEVYYTNTSVLEKQECVNNDCPSRAAASGVTFTCEEDVCVNCGTVQQRGGEIGDCSDVTFREAEDDENRRIDAVKRQRVFKARKGAGKTEELEQACASKIFHHRLEELRSAEKAMRAAAEGSVSHLLPSNIPQLLRESELAQLQEKMNEEEKRLDICLSVATTDQYRQRLCQGTRDRVIGDFDGLDSRVHIIGANMSEDGAARPTRDLAELRENVHTHFVCYLNHKKCELVAANRDYKTAYKAALTKQTCQVSTVEDDGLTPIVDSTGKIANTTVTYDQVIKSIRELGAKSSEKDDIALQSVMRVVFGWVTFVFVFRGGHEDYCFDMDHWKLSNECITWEKNAEELLVRYRRLMYPSKPISAKKEVYCMHAIIIASWQTATPLSWRRVRPLFLGHPDEKDQEQLLHWSRKTNEHVLPSASLTHVLLELESMASQLQVRPDWPKLVRHFAAHYEGQLQRTYSFKVADSDNGVPSLIERVCKSAERTSHKNALRVQLGLDEELRLASALAPVAASVWEREQTLIDFSPEVVAISCVRAIYGTRMFALKATHPIEDKSFANALNIKVFRKPLFKKRPRVSVTKEGQSSATIKAETFNELAGVQSRDVAACLKIVQPLSSSKKPAS